MENGGSQEIMLPRNGLGRAKARHLYRSLPIFVQNGQGRVGKYNDVNLRISRPNSQPTELVMAGRDRIIDRLKEALHRNS